MSEQEIIATTSPVDGVDVTTEAEVIVKDTRRIAHWHMPDKRANQSGPITDGRPVQGRQKKEPCYEVIHHVKNPGGFLINERLYRGKVTVAQCVADYLTTMDREWERVESAIFRNNSLSRHLGNFSV